MESWGSVWAVRRGGRRDSRREAAVYLEQRPLDRKETYREGAEGGAGDGRGEQFLC